jgi:hypothetical protein
MPGVVIGDQRESRRDVKCFTDAHERAGQQKSVIGMYPACNKRDEGPNKQTAADGKAAAETIGDVAADGTEESVDPLELAKHPAPIRFGADVRDVRHDGEFHGGEHLAVEIVEQRHRPEQGDHQPGRPEELR